MDSSRETVVLTRPALPAGFHGGVVMTKSLSSRRDRRASLNSVSIYAAFLSCTIFALFKFGQVIYRRDAENAEKSLGNLCDLCASAVKSIQIPKSANI
jgi:hypothetical protein